MGCSRKSKMFDDKTRSLPTVSVIVPTYNAEKNIANLIESLLNLDYPTELLEIIIVDNNSNDRTKEIVKQYPIKLLEEKNIQSSYAARNIGIKTAKGEILAFTDVDCITDTHWIKYAISCGNKADLVAGNVIFTKKSKYNIFEIFDSHFYKHQEYNASIGTSTTANLIVKKHVFNVLGPFPVVKTGGDIIWTRMATNKGYKMVYCENSKVFHPARKSLKETIEREIRFLGVSRRRLVKLHYKEIQDKVFFKKGKNLNARVLIVIIFVLKKIFTFIAVFTLLINDLSKKIRR
ncbi:MAG: glycosyltransferase [Candidatus Hodarchaeota archaeon]